jgi:uncharacterized damage-inducible protein DinB
VGERFAEHRWFVAAAFGRLVEQAARAGDELVSVRPPVEGANSVFAIVTHCLGVADFWLDHVLLGHPTERDRPAEFVATGDLATLEGDVAAFLDRLPDLMAAVAELDAPRLPYRDDEPWVETVEGVLLHVVEELSQHLGHVDLTVDLLLRPA